MKHGRARALTANRPVKPGEPPRRPRATSRRPDPHTLERHLAEFKSILAGLRSGDTTADPLPVILVGPLPGGLIAAAYT